MPEPDMSEPHKDDTAITARLRRLPGQALLALLNGTAVLVIFLEILLISDAALLPVGEEALSYSSYFASLANPVIILFLGGFLADAVGYRTTPPVLYETENEKILPMPLDDGRICACLGPRV